MTDKESEKRRHPRHRVSAPAHAKIDGQTVDGEIVDLSASGAAVRLVNLALDVDDYLDIEIENVGEIGGRVVRTMRDLLAVRFVDVDEDEMQRVLAYLSQLSADGVD
jgi:hypothetical protein